LTRLLGSLGGSTSCAGWQVAQFGAAGSRLSISARPCTLFRYPSTGARWPKGSVRVTSGSAWQWAHVSTSRKCDTVERESVAGKTACVVWQSTHFGAWACPSAAARPWELVA